MGKSPKKGKFLWNKPTPTAAPYDPNEPLKPNWDAIMDVEKKGNGPKHGLLVSAEHDWAPGFVSHTHAIPLSSVPASNDDLGPYDAVESAVQILKHHGFHIEGHELDHQAGNLPILTVRFSVAGTPETPDWKLIHAFQQGIYKKGY